MVDTYRIIGKADKESTKPLYLLEVKVTRSVLISQADMAGLFAALSESNSDGGWDEVKSLIQSGFEDGINPDDVPLFETPWIPANFSNENLAGLLEALKIQDEDLAFHGSGSPEAGGITFTANISGRQYSRTVTSSAEAKRLAESMTELKTIAMSAKWKRKTIEKIATFIDWILRAAGIYELAEKAWETAREKIEAAKEQRRFERELKEHIDREKGSGVERGREMDMADRISRTA